MRERLVTQRPTVWRYQADARAALASYQQVARSRKGQVVLWACPSDSGAGGVLQGLAGLLGQATPRPMVVGGSFAGGQYVPWPAPRPSKVPLEELAGVVSKVVELAAPAVTAAVGAPWLASAGKLLGQLAEVSGAVRELLETHAGQGRPVPLDPDGLKALLRRAALERPVMCLLEDLDQVESRQAWWSAFLRPLAAEAVRDLPLLLVVSLTGPHELGGHEREEPQPLFVARRLVEAGLASWRWLQPLTVADVAAWLRPCAPSLAAGLHTATSGDPRWLAALWEDWQARRVVRQAPEGTWEFAGPDAARLGRVNDLLDARLARLLGTGEPGPLETARELLATAALEGRRFTAPALAGALGRDPDELIDFLDEHLTVGDDHPDGLVVDVGFLKLHDPEGEPRFVSRYEFVSALHWQTLRRYGLGPSEEAERSERYGWALAEVYAPEPARVVPLIAPLLRAAGKRRAAADFDRRADFDTTLAAQRRHALAVLNMPTDAWDQWDYVQATALLLRAAEAMVYACPPRETLAVYEGAAALAQRADLRPERVTALLGRGYLHLLLGEYVQAGQILGVTISLHGSLASVAQPSPRPTTWATLSWTWTNSQRPGGFLKKLSTALVTLASAIARRCTCKTLLGSTARRATWPAPDRKRTKRSTSFATYAVTNIRQPMCGPSWRKLTTTRATSRPPRKRPARHYDGGKRPVIESLNPGSGGSWGCSPGSAASWKLPAITLDER